MHRVIPDPGFAGDDGSADVAVAAALSVYLQDPDGGYLPALAALSASRVLVPVVALGEESAGVEMAAVLMQRSDGARALLAFTSTDAMTAWDPRARPVPVPASTAALTAVQEQAQALLLDVAGPAQLAVEGDDLRQLAGARRLVALGDGTWGWARDVHSSG